MRDKKKHHNKDIKRGNTAYHTKKKRRNAVKTGSMRTISRHIMRALI